MFCKVFSRLSSAFFLSSPRWGRIFYLQTFFLFVCGSTNTYWSSRGFEWNPKSFFCKFSFSPEKKKDISLKESWRKAQKRKRKIRQNQVSSRRIFNLCFLNGRGGGGLRKKFFNNKQNKVNQKIWWKNGRQKVLQFFGWQANKDWKCLTLEHPLVCFSVWFHFCCFQRCQGAGNEIVES